MSRPIPASIPSVAPQASPDTAQMVPGVVSIPAIELPDHWNPVYDDFDHTTSGSERYWAAIHRCGRAYRRHISEALNYPPAHERNETRVMTPLMDLELKKPSPWADNGGLDEGMNPRAWEVDGPANDSTPADRRLLRGTLLEPAGWTGDQTEGLELLVWKIVGGTVGGHSYIYTPVGGRYGADGWLLTALLVDPREELLRDVERSVNLLNTLSSLAFTIIREPLPQLPPVVCAVLNDALTLDPARLLRQTQARSDQWSNAELSKLVLRAKAAADPDLMRALARWEIGEILSRALQGQRGKMRDGHPMNSLAGQTLWRAALAQMAPGLTPDEIARLSEGWERVRAKSRHSQHWWSRRNARRAFN